MFFVNSQSGQWILSPKIRLILIHKKIWALSDLEPGFHHSSKDLRHEKALFKYSHRSASLLANELFYKNGSSSLDQKKYDFSYPTKGLFLSKVKGIAKFAYFSIWTYISNLYKIYKNIGYTLVFPPLLFPMLLFGLIGEPWTKELWRINLSLLAIIIISSSFLLSHLDFRFFFPIVPIVLLWCAMGIVCFSKRAVASLKNIGKIVSFNLVTYLIVGIIVSSVIPSMVSICITNHNQRREQKEIATLIEKNVPFDATVIARNPQSCYLAKRKYAPLPYLTFEELLDYASRFSKSALVLTKQDEPLRPELSHRLNQLIGGTGENAPYKIVLDKGCTIVNFD